MNFLDQILGAKKANKSNPNPFQTITITSIKTIDDTEYQLSQEEAAMIESAYQKNKPIIINAVFDDGGISASIMGICQRVNAFGIKLLQVSGAGTITLINSGEGWTGFANLVL